MVVELFLGHDVVDEAVVHALLSAVNATIGERAHVGVAHIAAVSDDADKTIVDLIGELLINGDLLFSRRFVGTAHELVGAAVHSCDIDAEFFKKLGGVDKLSADDADGTNEAVAIGDDLIGSGRNVISAGRAVVFAVCVDGATSFFLIIHQRQVRFVALINGAAW